MAQDIAALIREVIADTPAGTDQISPAMAPTDPESAEHGDKALHRLQTELGRLSSSLGASADPHAAAEALGMVDDPTKLAEWLGGLHDPEAVLAMVGREMRFPSASTPEGHTTGGHSHHAAIEKLPGFREVGRVLEGLSESAREVVYALLTQLPAVPALVVLVQKALKSLPLSEANEDREMRLQLELAISNLLFGKFSSVADNIASYLGSEKNAFELIREALGDLLDRDPYLKFIVVLVALKIAEIYGSGTKAGNGPNFSNNRKNIVRGDNAQGVEVEQSPFDLGNSHFLGQNHFAATAALGSYLVLQGLLAHAVHGAFRSEAAH